MGGWTAARSWRSSSSRPEATGRAEPIYGQGGKGDRVHCGLNRPAIYPVPFSCRPWVSLQSLGRRWNALVNQQPQPFVVRARAKSFGPRLGVMREADFQPIALEAVNPLVITRTAGQEAPVAAADVTALRRRRWVQPERMILGLVAAAQAVGLLVLPQEELVPFNTELQFATLVLEFAGDSFAIPHLPLPLVADQLPRPLYGLQVPFDRI